MSGKVMLGRAVVLDVLALCLLLGGCAKRTEPPAPDSGARPVATRDSGQQLPPTDAGPTDGEPPEPEILPLREPGPPVPFDRQLAPVEEPVPNEPARAKQRK